MMYEIMSKAVQQDRERAYRDWDERRLLALPDGIKVARKRVSLAKWVISALTLVLGK